MTKYKQPHVRDLGHGKFQSFIIMLMRFRYCLIMPAKPSKLVRLSTAFYVYQRSFITLLIIKISNIHIIINIRIHSDFPCKALPSCFSFISCLPYKIFFQSIKNSLGNRQFYLRWLLWVVGCPVVTGGAIVLTAPPEAAEIEREKVKGIHLAFLGPVYMK